MRAWLVRAGGAGEREGKALEEGKIFPGFTHTDINLAQFSNKSHLKSVLAKHFDGSVKSRTLSSWVGQMWRLAHVMKQGDYVVMPLKNEQANFVAVGKITGNYVYDEHASEGLKHYRPVEWAESPIPKDRLGADLRNSLGSLQTICLVQRNDAALRIEKTFESGEDPSARAQDLQVEDWLSRTADKIGQGQTVSISIRELLEIFNFYRRTAKSVEAVTEKLGEYGLSAEPPITSLQLNAEVRLEASTETEEKSAEEPENDLPFQEIETAVDGTDSALSCEVRYAVSTLGSANREVLSFTPDTPLETAITAMMLHDYSQIAVVNHEDRLLGAITWKSITLAMASSKPTSVQDAMIEAQAVSPFQDLLTVTPQISEYDYVFVQDDHGLVQGIVTASDLTLKFGDDHAPIVKLDEIEKRLKTHIENRLTDEEISDEGVHIPHYGKTLATYKNILQNEALWERVGWTHLDREKICQLVDKVRRVRNDIMHFSPDPITESELDILDRTTSALRLITRLEVDDS